MLKKPDFTAAPWSLDDLGVNEPGFVGGPDDYHRLEAGKGHYPEGFSITGYLSVADAKLMIASPLLAEALHRIHIEYHGETCVCALDNYPCAPCQTREALRAAGYETDKGEKE